jgi:hypothetical protein
MPKYDERPSVREEMNGNFAAVARRAKIESRTFLAKKKGKPAAKKPPPERFVPRPT